MNTTNPPVIVYHMVKSLRFHHQETRKDSDSGTPPYNPSGLFKNPQRDAEKTQSFFRHLGVDYSG